MTHNDIEFIHLLDERSEEALTMIAEMESLSLEQLQTLIDRRRPAHSGFAHAVKVFSVSYFRTVLEERYKAQGRAPRAGRINSKTVVERVLASRDFLNAVNDDDA